jgi:primosomal protein N' (replication factor Y)
MDLFSPPPLFVEVAVPLPLDRLYTYRVPRGEEGKARAGMRVLVPFGRKRLTGLVASVASFPAVPGVEPKEVLSFLDPEPYVPEGALAFLFAAARECLAPPGEMLRAALPRGLARHDSPPSLRSETVFRVTPALPAPDRMTPKQRAVAEAVAAAGGEIASSALDGAVPGGADAARRMEGRGWIASSRRTKEVRVDARALPDTAPSLSPTGPQEQALSRIGMALASGEHAVFVLQGVTGSGKTEVYLRAVEQARAGGRPSILLVPEIALTPQLLGRVRSRFGQGAAVLHSGLTPAERLSEWRRVREGEAFLCVGARSAVFAPFDRPGLIVVDEEHDGAYKQEDGIRYQARDLAILRARMEGAVAILGSATPSAETAHRVKCGAAERLSLPERVEGRPLPEVEIVDLRARSGGRGADRYFSPRLEEAVEEVLSRGEKAMLFLNRRGYAPVLSCLDCGTAVECDHCRVSLTFHREENALVCHYCDARKPPPESCPACGGHKVAQLGLGTERLAAWAEKRWKDARVARLDSDVGKVRGASGEVLARMHRGDVDILVGTQMIAKGHDFPDVTLVCVLFADGSLTFPDFRAAERTFQVLSQVSGRAGRGDRPGRVIVQTLVPGHPCLAKVAAHDTDGFLEEELASRESLGYPPFGRMVLFRLRGEKEERTGEAAEAAAALLREAVPEEEGVVLGPAPSPVSRVKGLFRFQVLLKGAADLDVAGRLFPLLPRLREEARRKGAILEADVDPYHMLV